jgi:hypothetical protein
VRAAGLPDDVFSTQISHFGYILEGLGMEYIGTFCGHLEYITIIWYIIRLFGNL